MRAAVWALTLPLALAPAGPRPAVAASPLACASPCEIRAVQVGYLPPAAEILSGSAVRWTTTDASHPTANSPIDACFRVPVGAGVPPTDVRFDIVGSELQATVEGQSKPCHNAVPLPTGAFAMPFQCMLHPFMVGALIVEPR